jgi:phosphatidylglycerol:prolipoprotein diacylglycerol transferase
MSTHGLLLGGVLAAWLFSLWKGRSFLSIVDELSVPAAWVLATGRLGNFIDGQIMGAETDVWWAVKFPDAEGFRHPVVLYDGLKNLLLIPFLMWVGSRRPPQGIVFAHFIFWYSFLRFLTEQFREYRVDLLNLGTGQVINLAMALSGICLFLWFQYRRLPRSEESTWASKEDRSGSGWLWGRATVLAVILAFCLIISSDWTQDIPKRYGHRHPDMTHSWVYPVVPER